MKEIHATEAILGTAYDKTIKEYLNQGFTANPEEVHPINGRTTSLFKHAGDKPPANRSVPVLTEDGIVYKEGVLNAFSGIDTDERQVLKSAAGFYIGTLYYDREMVGWFPEDRYSANYWSDRDKAEEALMTGKYTINI